MKIKNNFKKLTLAVILAGVTLGGITPARGELFKVTAYCSCKKCCGNSRGITKSGVKCHPGTCATDWSIIPKFTKIHISGETFIAEDTGSAIKGKRIDLWKSSHKEALKFGVKYLNVKISQGEENEENDES